MSFVGSSSNSTSSATTLSTAIPSSVQAGDVAWLLIDLNEDADFASPTGWSLQELQASSGQKRARYTKVLTAGDAGEMVTATKTTQGKWIIQVLVFRDVDPNQPEASVTPATTINDDGVAIPMATTTQTTDQFVVMGARNPDITNFSPPDGWTVVEQHYISGGGSHQVASAYRENVGAGVVSGSWTSDVVPVTDAASTLVVINQLQPSAYRYDGANWIPLGRPRLITGEDPTPPEEWRPLWGAAVNGTGDSLDPLEVPAGRPLGVHRTYWNDSTSSTNGAISSAAASIALGRVPWMSFKFSVSWTQVAAGQRDAWATNLGNQLAALGGQVMVTFHHEPEGDEPMSGFVPMSDRMYSFMKPHDNIRTGPILTAWNAVVSGNPEYELDHMWPDEFTSGDFIGFDAYNFYGNYESVGNYNSSTGVWTPQPGETPNMNINRWRELSLYSNHFANWAQSKGTKWAIGEFGFSDHAADYELAEYGEVRWLRNAWDNAIELGGCYAMAYFSSAYNSSCDWRVHSDPDRLGPWLEIMAESPSPGTSWPSGW